LSIQKFPDWLQLFLYIFLIIFQSSYLNFLINQHRLYKERTNLIAAIYFLLVTGQTFSSPIHPAIIANTMVLPSLYYFLKIYLSQNVLSKIFFSALLSSIAFLFYTPYLVFAALLFFGYFILRNFHLKEFLALLLGYSVIPVLISEIFFLFDQNPFIVFSVSFTFSIPSNIFFSPILIFYGYLIILMLFFIRYYYKRLIFSTIKTRKFYQLFLIYLFFSLVIFLLIEPGHKVTRFYILLIPLSFYITGYFIYSRKKIAHVFFLLFFLISLGIHFFQCLYQ
jgi:hypothetical protein